MWDSKKNSKIVKGKSEDNKLSIEVNMAIKVK